jgi:hypothetical protein
MRCLICNGGTPEAPCVCETEAELANTPDYPMDERFMLPPRDPRDEYRSPEDFTPPAWAERYDS